nr:reverse transcriptase domain-containing protein [Tanacetum cinerariifolium]
MSEASSTVTYTSIYTDSKPGRVFWGADEELSDGGSLRVIVYGYDGLPMMPVAPPSLDYIPGPKEPHTPPTPQDKDEYELMFIQPHDPDFVPKPIYPEYILLEDEHILLAEEQPLPPVVSPTAESPGYVAESDPEEDPEEYEEDEAEDGPVDNPMDGGEYEDDDDDGNSSGYDADDEDEDNEDEEEEEEHLALADFTVVIPIDELVAPPEGIDSIIPPPSTNTATIGARITIRPQTFISLPPEAERLAKCIDADALQSPPLPPSSYPPPPVDRRDGIPESEQPPRKRLCLATLGSRYEIGESSTRGQGVDYGFTDTVKAEMRQRGIREVGQVMEPVTRQGHNPPSPNTNTPPHHMIPESVQAMIDQALLRNSTNRDGSQSVVGLTRCIEKMESIFNISGCAIENQDLFPSAQSANAITMARVLRSATSATRNAQGWVYAVGNAEKNRNAPTNLDSNVVMGTFLLNNRYVSILFDTSADRSFISIAFSLMVNINPTPLGSSYDVELADWKIVGIDTIIRGCTINFQNHPFNIDLMPVELGSFDVVIGMDWLRKCHAMIVCDEKLVQIPYGNETLTFRGNESNNGRESRLAVISCSKAQEYMAKGCQIFLAQISAKKEGD